MGRFTAARFATHSLIVRRMSKNIGSIYCIDLDNEYVRYFWYVGIDNTQLNSAIIVVFRSNYSKSEPVDLDEIISDEIDFYCHTFVLVGKRLGFWKKVGFRKVTRSFYMLFRDTNDYGDPKIQTSDQWYIWKPNGPFQMVGRLTGENTKAEIGVVVPADSVVARIKTGSYDFVYPSYA